MFLHLSVILSTGEGVSTSVHAGIHPPDTPWADTPRADTPPPAVTAAEGSNVPLTYVGYC